MKFVLTSGLWFLCLVFSASFSFAAGKPKPNVPQLATGKLRHVVRIHTIPDRWVEFPSVDSSGTDRRAYGKNITERLITHLVQDGHFIVLVDPNEGQNSTLSIASQSSLATSPSAPNVPVDPVHFDRQAPLVDTDLEGKVTALQFQTGERADRTFYGFREDYDNAYTGANEFPIRNSNASHLNWFGRTFDDTGDLHIGMDLASELNFELLWVGASLHWASYKARMAVESTFKNQSWMGTGTKVKSVSANANGFYFEVSGEYQGVTIAVMLARRAVFLDSFLRTIDGLVKLLVDALAHDPVAVRLAVQDTNGDLYVDAGAFNFNVARGQRFYSRSAWERRQVPAVFSVSDVFQTVSKVTLTSGQYQIGDTLVSLQNGDQPPSLPVADSVAQASSTSERSSVSTTLPNQNMPVSSELQSFIESPFVRFWKGLLNLLLLPYRIARFMQYDQAFSGGEMWQADLSRALAVTRSNWAIYSVGADQIWPETMGSTQTVVAVLDTGVDYNHQDLRRNIYWDGNQNSPGYDFYADDPRPYDDHSHGTAVASVIAGGGWNVMGVAPRATILPVKIFNSYGETTSAAIYAGFQYAVQKGARIIVCGWTTTKDSQAIREGIALAKQRGVLVVAASGDTGNSLDRSPLYPAALSLEFDNVITVAGHDRSGALMRRSGILSSSSDYGSPVNIAAPSAEVLTAGPRNGYGESSYTGVAAGMTAGAAALLWGRCPGASYSAIKQALIEGAATYSALRGEVVGNKALYIPTSLAILKTHCN